MKIIKGDLLRLAVAGDFDAIAQGCNCFCVMSAGLAKQIKSKFPEAYLADCETIKGDRSKLGKYTYANIQRVDGSTFTVFNAYTQYKYGRGKDLFEYKAFQEVLDRFKGIDSSLIALGEPRLRWGFPLIGCGLAGGDKELVLKMIEETLADVDVTIVEFE